MSRHLTRLWKSLSRLGPKNGAAVFGAYVTHRLFQAAKWRPRALRLRGLARPVWLRPGVSDWIVLERIFLDREYDPLSAAHDAAMDRLAAQMLAAGKIPLIIDCGANVGLSAVWFAARFAGAAIVAIEPEPGNFAVLARNATNYPAIVPMHAAVSDRAGRIKLSNESTTSWAWKSRECADGEVAAVTIAQVMAGDPRYALLAVKMDIEGFEVEVMRSGTEWVEALPLLMFEMHDWLAPWSGSGHALFSRLVGCRRDYLVRGENVFCYRHEGLKEGLLF